MRERPALMHRWKSGLRRRRPQRGLTLIEALTALVVTLIFVGGVTAAFIQIVRAADEAEAMVRANSAARGAVDQIANELRQLQLDANREFRQLRLINRPLAHGNNMDMDGSGEPGQSHVNGRDGEGSWTTDEDRHAQIGPHYERPNFVDLPDLGDDLIDTDVRFSADEISWIVAGTGGQLRVGYRIDEFEGEENVLVRWFQEGDDPVQVEPVIFDVVSLDILAWDVNAEIKDESPFQPIVPYWVEEWDSVPILLEPDRFVPGVNPPLFPDGQPVVQVEPFYIPPSFYIRVTVNADPLPLREIPRNDWPMGDRPLNTVAISTVVNVESVLHGQLYYDYIRE